MLRGKDKHALQLNASELVSAFGVWVYLLAYDCLHIHVNCRAGEEPFASYCTFKAGGKACMLSFIRLVATIFCSVHMPRVLV